MYLDHGGLGQPGQGKATYLFAHAREGMFLPLLRDLGEEAAGHGRRGLDQRRLALPVRDRRRAAGAADLDDALAADCEELWLQTSEGPKGTVGKTQVIAMPLSVERADLDEANPEPHIDRCG